MILRALVLAATFSVPVLAANCETKTLAPPNEIFDHALMKLATGVAQTFDLHSPLELEQREKFRLLIEEIGRREDSLPRSFFRNDFRYHAQRDQIDADFRRERQKIIDEYADRLGNRSDVTRTLKEVRLPFRQLYAEAVAVLAPARKSLTDREVNQNFSKLHGDEFYRPTLAKILGDFRPHLAKPSARCALLDAILDETTNYALYVSRNFSRLWRSPLSMAIVALGDDESGRSYLPRLYDIADEAPLSNASISESLYIGIWERFTGATRPNGTRSN